jgi:hypothetical protein
LDGYFEISKVVVLDDLPLPSLKTRRGGLSQVIGRITGTSDTTQASAIGAKITHTLIHYSVPFAVAHSTLLPIILQHASKLKHSATISAIKCSL